MIYDPAIPCSLSRIFFSMGVRGVPGKYDNLRPWSKSPPLYIRLRVAPDGQHLDSTMYMYSVAVYVHCVDDWNERGDLICLSHRLQQ